MSRIGRLFLALAIGVAACEEPPPPPPPPVVAIAALTAHPEGRANETLSVEGYARLEGSHVAVLPIMVPSTDGYGHVRITVHYVERRVTRYAICERPDADSHPSCVTGVFENTAMPIGIGSGLPFTYTPAPLEDLPDGRISVTGRWVETRDDGFALLL